MNWKFWESLGKHVEKIRKISKSEESMTIDNTKPFPCASDDCLVRMMECRQACDKIIIDGDKLKEAFLQYNACPDCGSEKFREGPSGGMSQNVKCSGCGHWFNVALPLFIERIHIDDKGRFYRQ